MLSVRRALHQSELATPASRASSTATATASDVSRPASDPKRSGDLRDRALGGLHQLKRVPAELIGVLVRTTHDGLLPIRSRAIRCPRNRCNFTAYQNDLAGEATPYLIGAAVCALLACARASPLADLSRRRPHWRTRVQVRLR